MRVQLLGHVDPAQKDQLAMQLLANNGYESLLELIVYPSIQLQIRDSLARRKCTKLPLPEDPLRPRIDYIAFMLDLHSLESLKVLEHNLTQVEFDFFHGRSCIVVCNGGKQSGLAFSRSEVGRIARDYELVVINSTLEMSSQVCAAQVAEEIAKRVSLACREHSHISPLLLMPPFCVQPL
eukprot:TRINITY_DN4155_c0_g1_i4.p1 TRINITY_DN4155_c0_g1~~TRINITY_DN4155_c0_g1_i4.p1  ORF type:complete len:180 (-),score=32.52 TRINITY_DN4155_c0_g1_i4:436-975(-)